MDEYILSKYNVFKIINDSAIGVNLYNKMLFALDKEKYNTLIKNSHNLKKLKIHDPVFFSTMSKLGIIQRIDSESTLNKKILLENRLIVFKDKSYRLTINPTLNCNFSCWYCYEAHPKKRMSKNVINATIKYIEHLVNNLKINNLNLDWFGGEPLLCYKTTMYPLANEAKKVCDQNHVSFQSGMTTNGYLIRPEMIPFFKKVNMNSFQITLDGEKDQHDKTRCCKNGKPSYDKIVQNIILLASELSLDNLAVRINYTKKSFNGIFKIIDSFPYEIRSKITILLQQVWQDKDNKKSSIKEIEEARLTFEKSGFKVDKQILNCKGYTCYADLYNQAVINYDGRVFKCTARNFEKEKEDGLLSEDGKILWTNSLAKKTANSTFENQKCLNCKYLPVCFGPCSQKVNLVKDITDFQKYCFELGIKHTLDYMMKEFEKSGKALTPILDYR